MWFKIHGIVQSKNKGIAIVGVQISLLQILVRAMSRKLFCFTHRLLSGSFSFLNTESRLPFHMRFLLPLKHVECDDQKIGDSGELV